MGERHLFKNPFSTTLTFGIVLMFSLLKKKKKVKSLRVGGKPKMENKQKKMDLLICHTKTSHTEGGDKMHPHNF